MVTRVWLITGASGGPGRPLVSEVLSAGGRVIATSRNDVQRPAAAPLGSDVPAGIEKTRVDQLDELRRFAPLSASTDHTDGF